MRFLSFAAAFLGLVLVVCPAWADDINRRHGRAAGTTFQSGRSRMTTRFHPRIS